MTREELLQEVAAVLLTLHEMAEEGLGAWAPQSSVYLALGADMGRWQTVSGALARAGLVRMEHDTIILTDAGRAKARELDAALPKAR